MKTLCVLRRGGSLRATLKFDIGLSELKCDHSQIDNRFQLVSEEVFQVSVYDKTDPKT